MSNTNRAQYIIKNFFETSGGEIWYQGWDAVRVIEPSWHKDKDDESLVILNPHIVQQIG